MPRFAGTPVEEVKKPRFGGTPVTPEQQPVEKQLSAVGKIGRTVGMAGRTVASGYASLADVALLAPKTLAAGAEGIAEASGLKGTRLERGLEKIRTLPTMRESTQGVIDQVTGGILKPKTTSEKIITGAGELAFPFGVYGKATQTAEKMPGILSAAKDVLNPMEAAASIAMKKYPAPLNMQSIKKLGFEDVKKEAQKAYKYAEETGGILRPQAANKFIEKMWKATDPENPRIKRVFKKGPVSDLLNDITKEYTGKPMTLSDVEALDQRLTKEASRYFSKIEGAKPEYGDIKAIQSALRDAVEESVNKKDVFAKTTEGFDALKRATQLYARGKRLEDVDDIVQKALDQEQPARALRRGFARLKNSKSFNKFSKQEQNLIKKIAEEKVSDDALKFFSSRLLGLMGVASGQPIAGSAIYAGGMGVRALEKAGALAKVNKLEDEILRGTGFAGSKIPKVLTPTQKGILGTSANVMARGQQ